MAVERRLYNKSLVKELFSWWLVFNFVVVFWRSRNVAVNFGISNSKPKAATQVVVMRFLTFTNRCIRPEKEI